MIVDLDVLKNNVNVKVPTYLPTLGPVCPKTALSAAMVRSATMCRMCPPPIAYPATIAIIGLGQRRICTWRSKTLSRGTSSDPSSYPPSPLTWTVDGRRWVVLVSGSGLRVSRRERSGWYLHLCGCDNEVYGDGYK